MGKVASWFVMFGIGAMLMASLVVPRAAGAMTYVIETGSMRPHLPPGTMVAIQPVDASAVRVGDVITYQLRSGDPTVVTHRVVAVGYDGDGQLRWQTQGDANPTADKLWVEPAQLRGRLWYGVPLLGHVTAIVTQQQRGLIYGALALGLIGYALTQFGSAWHDRRRRTHPIGATGGGRRKA